MSSEKFANLAETTLASGYTSGGGSISVTSASGFPTAGVFRVRLGNAGKTIFRVDSVSGTTFTGGAEANDANASAGDTVINVGTRAVGERFLQSPETGEANAPSGVSGADDYWPNWKVKRLDQSGWSWVNQGAASVDQQKGMVQLLSPASVAGTSVRARVTTAPGTPYTIEMGLVPYFPTAGSVSNLAAIGIAFRESGTGKMVVIFFANFKASSGTGPSAIFVATYTNATTFNTNLAEFVTVILPPSYLAFPVMWLRVTDNGTNLIFEYSYDRVHWTTLTTAGRTAFMAGGPDQIGVVWTVQSSSVEAGGWVLSWIQT